MRDYVQSKEDEIKKGQKRKCMLSEMEKSVDKTAKDNFKRKPYSGLIAKQKTN